MPVARSTLFGLNVPLFFPGIFPGARPVSTNHLVASSIPPEKVSLKVGGFTAGTLRTGFVACPVPFWATDRETMNSNKTRRTTLRIDGPFTAQTAGLKGKR